MKIINLLPKHRQSEIHYEIIFRSLLRFFMASAVSFGLVFLSLIGTRFYVLYQSANIDRQTDAIKNFANKQENTVLRNQVKGVNNTIKDFQDLAGSTPRWSKVLAAFAPLVPQEVKIQSFTADTKKKQVNIIGYSPTRDKVIALYNNVNQDTKNFSNIDYPLENVSKPENISFHFTFTIKDELLK